MNEMLSRMDPALLIPLFGLLIPIFAIVGSFWHSARKAEAEAALKRDLLAAGTSPDDIVRIVSATAGGKLPPAAPPRA